MVRQGSGLETTKRALANPAHDLTAALEREDLVQTFLGYDEEIQKVQRERMSKFKKKRPKARL